MGYFLQSAAVSQDKAAALAGIIPSAAATAGSKIPANAYIISSIIAS